MEGNLLWIEDSLALLSQKIKVLREQIIRICQNLASVFPASVYRRIIRMLYYTGILILLFIISAVLPPVLQHRIKPVSKSKWVPAGTTDTYDTFKAQKKLEGEIAKLDRKLTSMIPRSYYLVINSAENKIFLYKGKNLVHKGICSTGSYILLQNGEQQKWLFKTPRGEFRVQNKKRFPVWKKPDWAFIEEGLPVPPVNHSSRFEYGVLGEYALSLRDGYLIHGTLYQRFLGLPVTHGCIRLNDMDLEIVYRALNTGSKVYIY